MFKSFVTSNLSKFSRFSGVLGTHGFMPVLPGTMESSFNYTWCFRLHVSNELGVYAFEFEYSGAIWTMREGQLVELGNNFIIF